MLSAGEQVVDCAASGPLQGEAPEPRPGVAAGHMPGSLNLPFDRIVQGGELVAPDAVEMAFAEAGVDLNRSVITIAAPGVSAAILSLAMETTGREARAIYDGSWAEWGSLPDALSPPAVRMIRGRRYACDEPPPLAAHTGQSA